MWMREIRKLTQSGHQTSLISTAFELKLTRVSARMFSRWCQENFFRYMMEHFAIDLLQEYGTEKFPDTEQVVNPAWRILERKRNSIQNKLRYRQARFGEMSMYPQTNDNAEKYAEWVNKKANLFEEVEQHEVELSKIKSKIKQTPKHITWDNLKDQDKFLHLLPERKRLMDTVKMIAYRAETSMAGIFKSETIDMPAARRLLQDLYLTEADILPNVNDKSLTIRVHNASRPAANKALNQLFNELNSTALCYPGTNMKMKYVLACFGSK
jgi:hypothetical protein